MLSETRKEYNKKYYAEHRESIINKMMESHHCYICGGKYLLCNRTKHNKSKKHQAGLKIVEQQKQLDELLTTNK